jgi:hypothetical protein
VTFSLAPVLFGLYSGQMHAFVLFGSLLAVLLVLDSKPWHAGAIVGLLAIKPQVALGFLIFFLARKDFRALTTAALGFAGLNALLVKSVGWATAVSLYIDYAEATRSLVMLPFVDGFPSYLLLTPYGFLSGLVAAEHQGTILVLSNVLALATVVWFWRDAWSLRSTEDATPLLLGRTLLLPSLITPYLMAYDAAPVLLACLLIAPAMTARRVLALGAAVYGWFWVFPPISALIGVPLGALAPAGLWISSSGLFRTQSESPTEPAAQRARESGPGSRHARDGVP